MLTKLAAGTRITGCLRQTRLCPGEQRPRGHLTACVPGKWELTPAQKPVADTASVFGLCSWTLARTRICKQPPGLITRNQEGGAELQFIHKHSNKKGRQQAQRVKQLTARAGYCSDTAFLDDTVTTPENRKLDCRCRGWGGRERLRLWGECARRCMWGDLSPSCLQPQEVKQLPKLRGPQMPKHTHAHAHVWPHNSTHMHKHKNTWKSGPLQKRQHSVTTSASCLFYCIIACKMWL